MPEPVGDPRITARDRRGRLDVGVGRTPIGFGRATIVPGRNTVGDVREEIESRQEAIELDPNVARLAGCHCANGQSVTLGGQSIIESDRSAFASACSLLDVTRA
jgi:hypothetical protein